MLFKKMFLLTRKLTVDCKTLWSSVTAVGMSADDLTFLPFGVAQCTVFTKPVVSRQMWSRAQQAPWDLGLAPLKVRSCSNAKQCTVSLS